MAMRRTIHGEKLHLSSRGHREARDVCGWAERELASRRALTGNPGPERGRSYVMAQPFAGDVLTSPDYRTPADLTNTSNQV